MHGLIYILVYVGDRVVVGENLDGVKAVKNLVSATLDVRDMREVKDSIGMKAKRDRAAKMLILSNAGHVIALFEASGMSNFTLNRTPMVSAATLDHTGEHLLP